MGSEPPNLEILLNFLVKHGESLDAYIFAVATGCRTTTESKHKDDDPQETRNFFTHRPSFSGGGRRNRGAAKNEMRDKSGVRPTRSARNQEASGETGRAHGARPRPPDRFRSQKPPLYKSRNPHSPHYCFLQHSSTMSAKINLYNNTSIDLPTGLFINNEFRPSSDGSTFTTPNPATGEDLVTLSAATEKDIDAAVAAAREAFENVWGKNSTPGERAEIMNKWADLIEEDIENLAQLESLDNGKPIWMARDVDIVDSIGCLRYYAGLADKIEGRTIELQEGVKVAFTRPEPIGVCGQIIPWNYPIQMFAWKVAPALAAGNTIVMKPAEQTPCSALRLAELAVKAGFPPGVLNIVNGLGAVAGSAIANHMDIDKIAFTGSTVTGRKIMASAANSNLKKVTLELGGKSPVVVFDSVDIDQTANWVCMAILFNHGQDCCAGSRLFIQDTIKDKFLEVLKRKVEEIQIGDPSDIKTFMGPLVSKAQHEKVKQYIKYGEEQGAKLLTGGSAKAVSLADKFKNGYFVTPTVFTECKKGMKIVDDEIFGPVLAVQSFTTEEEAVKLANDTAYGLGGGIFSQNASQCMRMVHAIKAGTVWCNQYMALSNAVPFGGMKQSGFGRELGIEGLKEYTQTKAVHWNYGEEIPWPLDGTNV